MSRSKRLDRYDPSISELFQTAHENGRVTLIYPTHARAKAARGELYNFRTVLRGATISGAPTELILLKRQADRLKFSLQGTRLIVWRPGAELTASIQRALQ